MKFPLYRYGYSYIVTLIIFLGSFLLFKYNLSFVKKIFQYTIILSLFVILGKQIQRIHKNYNAYKIWPNIYSLSPKAKNIEIEEKIIGLKYKIFVSKKECMYINAPCTNIFQTKN